MSPTSLYNMRKEIILIVLVLMLKIIISISLLKIVSILAYKSIKIHNSCGPSCNNVALSWLCFPLQKTSDLKNRRGLFFAAINCLIVVHAILQLKRAKTYFCCQKIQKVFFKKICVWYLMIENTLAWLNLTKTWHKTQQWNVCLFLTPLKWK